MKELVIKRLEKLDVGVFNTVIKDYIENITNYMLEATRYSFLAHLISFEEYWDCYNLIFDFMSKNNLKGEEINV